MIYLNQAATSYPKPQRVLDAHAASLSRLPGSQFRSSMGGQEDILEMCRCNLSRLLGIEAAERIFLTSGATASANALIYGLCLGEANVVTTATEHNSILRPLLNLKQQVGNVTVVPCDKNGLVSPTDIKRSITEATKAVFVNHCSNVTGMIQDIRAMAHVTKESGVLLIVDVSQSAGCIPIRTEEWGIDGLIFTGHKSLFGAPGTGGHYLNPKVSLKPFQYGGTGLNSSRLLYEQEPYEYEVGTQNIPGFTALNEGVQYILARGIANIAKKEQKLVRQIYEALGKIKGVQLYGGYKDNKGPLVSFNIQGLKSSDAAYILQNAYSIVVRAGLHCAPLIHPYIGSDESGTVRVSISDLTTVDEIRLLIEAVQEIAGAI